MQTKVLEFDKVKETKNCVKFEERQQPGVPPTVGTLYVQKWAIGDAKVVHMTLSTLGGERAS